VALTAAFSLSNCADAVDFETPFPALMAEPPMPIEEAPPPIVSNAAPVDLLASEPIERPPAATKLSKISKITRASWYGPGFGGRRTASGERYNPNALTAASRNLPFGTMVEVTSPSSLKSVVVRINDRLAAWNRRGLDLSRRAASLIGLVGVEKVGIRKLDSSESVLLVAQEQCESNDCPPTLSAPAPFSE